MNFKKIILLIAVTIAFVGCKKDNEVFDHAAQYKTEKVTIENYLKSHYYDSTSDLFKDLVDGETALIDDDNLQAINTTYNNIDYRMYVYKTVEGVGNSPDSNDNINVEYKLMSLDNTLYQEGKGDNFFSVANLVTGWKIGMPSFKEGTYTEVDDSKPRQYSNSGEGFLIIPSGLAYQNYGNGSTISANETLIFKIVLRSVGKVKNPDE